MATTTPTPPLYRFTAHQAQDRRGGKPCVVRTSVRLKKRWRKKSTVTPWGVSLYCPGPELRGAETDIPYALSVRQEREILSTTRISPPRCLYIVFPSRASPGGSAATHFIITSSNIAGSLSPFSLSSPQAATETYSGRPHQPRRMVVARRVPPANWFVRTLYMRV